MGGLLFGSESENTETVCKVCDAELTKREIENGENLAYAKDRLTRHKVCNKCKRKLLKCHDEAAKFMLKDVFYIGVRK
jgi:hypothetical protein